MKASTSSSFKPVPLPPEQTTVARCYSVIHVGTIPNIREGKLDPKQPKIEKVYITWEMPHLKAEFKEGKGLEPFVVGVELTLSTGEKSNLSKLISNWRGRPLTPAEQKSFDPSVMLDKTCLIQFIHARKAKFRGKDIDQITNENTGIKLNSIISKPKEMECPPMINPKFLWDWEAIISGVEPFDVEKFKKIPAWLQAKLKESDEFKKYGAKYMPDEATAVEDSESAEEPVINQAPPATPVADGW